MNGTTYTSPVKRPNVLAGSGGRQFSFGGAVQANHARDKTTTGFASGSASQSLQAREFETDFHHIPKADLEDSGKSPFTYALHVVFTSFVRIGERKINTVLGPVTGPEPDLRQLLRVGADPAFDKILKSLGYIARRNPKPVIDSVMFWRKSRSELKSDSNPIYSQGTVSDALNPALTRRATEATRPSFVRSPSSSTHAAQSSDATREAAMQMDRKSLVSIFILCRSLIEIVEQINAETLGDEVGEKLEEIVFNQLRAADPETLQYSLLRSANWNMFAVLLGSLSAIRFASVSDRFIADLEKTTRGIITKDREPRVELLINGMRHLKIRIYPAASLEESAEFLSSLSRFFLDAHGFRVKQAYLDVFHSLIIPVAGSATAEVNYPAWTALVTNLLPRTIKLLEKARYWNSAFVLTSTLLCVSTRDLFIDKWYPLLEQNFSKFKDKALRTAFIHGVARLVWIAIFRWAEPAASLTRKMDFLFRTILPPGKRLQQTPDFPYEPVIQLIRFIGARHLDYCFKTLILPLICGDNISNLANSFDLDSFCPGRVTIAIRAFLYIIDDSVETTQIPPFPINFDSESITQHTAVDVHKANSSSARSAALDEYHVKFAAYLCRVAFLCDQHFGGQTNLEASAIQANQDSGNMSNAALMNRDKQQYYDLLAAILDAIPRCFVKDTPVPKVIEMICKATAHHDLGIRMSAQRALKTIATTTKVQSTIIGYARVLLNFDAQSPQYTEQRLRLYIDLLDLWIKKIKAHSQFSKSNGEYSASKDAAIPARGEVLEMTNIWTVIEETEAHGLYFLCSQSRAIRSYAIQILRSVAQFDVAMSGPSADKSEQDCRGGRIIDILTEEGASMLEEISDQASPAERSRTMKLRLGRGKNTLIEVAQSESGVDAAIWFKVFPRLVQSCFRQFPITVVLCRNVICTRLLKMHLGITAAIENLKSPSPFDVISRANTRIATSPESMIEQWKLYLIMACTTLTLTDEQTSGSNPQNNKKRGYGQVAFERITSARALFQLVLPMLSADHTSIRDAIVTALGCININLYKVLLEDMQPIMKSLIESHRQKLGTRHLSNRGNSKSDRLRTEVTHVLQLTSHFLSDEAILEDDWVLETVLNYLKDVKSFLSYDDVQMEWEYQSLRRHFCGLLEAVWEALLSSPNPTRWLPFEGRVSCFRLIEEWCSHGPHEHIAKEREDSMRQSILETYRDNRDRGALTASMEIEKRNVEFAALNAMASLCKGPVTQTPDMRTTSLSFEIDGIFAWIAAVFGSSSERIHSIGRKALTNLLKHNLDFTVLYQEAIHQCYTHDFDSKSAQSYFTVLAEVLTEQKSNPCGLSQLLALCLFKAGDKNVEIRIRTLALLEATEVRFYGRSCVEPFRAAIANQNPVMYKRGQYLLAAQIAKEHEEQRFHIFSECSKFFRLVETRLQRDVVAILLPWAQIIELQLDINGEDLDMASSMVLINLFEITLRFSDTLLNEVEGLWTALVTGRYAGNVKAILDFTISQSVARREPRFVNCGKQVVVYLARSPAGSKLTEALLAYIHPRSMVPQLKEPLRILPEEQEFTYVADLDRIFQGQQKHVVFSLGQLAMIFMVDLIVVPASEIVPQAPVLLLIVFLMLDHYIPLVQDQARELFVYLTYNLCVEKLEDQDKRKGLEEYLRDFRRRDSRFSWGYDEASEIASQNTSRIPETMANTLREVVEVYSIEYPNIAEDWGKAALSWGTSCPVRHMACRSFQVFRCLSSSIDQGMLSDMLARLSNTIADTSLDIQAFALEIMCTLDVVLEDLRPSQLSEFPQLFWCTIACLETIHEEEYRQALSMLRKLLDKIDLSNIEQVQFLISTRPPRWSGTFEGFSELLLKGLRSQECMSDSLVLINRVTALPSNQIVGSDGRLLFSVLANLPSYVHTLMEGGNISQENVKSSEMLASVASSQGLQGLSRILLSFAKSKFRAVEDLTRQMASVLRQTYFPAWEAATLIFLLGLLSNSAAWVKYSTMEILKAILPFVDTRRPEFIGVGADLISPLLRLLQTEYAQAGLEVLDKAISIPSGAKDRQVLRMSLGNRTIRKEYEKTATLFGIPDETGWAVPMPISAAASTRMNVHAVFYTCSVSVHSQDLPDHVQFHMEDYAYHAPSERSDTMLSVDGGESSLGDMVSALHNLDVFFTEDAGPTATTSSSETNVEPAPASVYDSRVAAILSRSLAKTPSISSFTSPGFDAVPRQERPSENPARQPVSPSAFSFPRQAKPTTLSPTIVRSPGLSQASDSDADELPGNKIVNEIVLEDDKSEASFKLDGQLKKSASTVRSKLWSNRDSEKQREKESKKNQKGLRIQMKTPKGQELASAVTSPVSGSRGYFWSSNAKERT